MSSRLAGGCMLIILGGGAAAALIVAAPTVGILTLWGVGFGALVWSIGRPRKIHNPSPPPPSPPLENEKPQVRIMQDPNNPARHIVEPITDKEAS